MPSCREIDPLFAPYIDGEATADQRAIVDAHLRACPKCRHQTALQAAVRDTVRDEAVSALCARGAAGALSRRGAHRASGRSASPDPRLASLSMAAALVLVVGGVLLYSLTGLSPTVLAAQLTLDHVKCFAVHDADAPVDARASEEQYARDYGGDDSVCRAPTIAGLQLVGMRRCFCGEGAAAHAMYRLNGRPVSLYVIPDASATRASTDVFGHDAVIWSKQGTYLRARQQRAARDARGDWRRRWKRRCNAKGRRNREQVMTTSVLRVAGVLGALALLSLAVPLPHVDEMRNADLSAVAAWARRRRRRSRRSATRIRRPRT